MEALSRKTGIVMRSTGSWYKVKDIAGGQILDCRLKGKFKIKNLKVTNPIAVGDKVIFNTEDHIIEEILPRQNYIIRQSIQKTAHGHLLAANVDQLILIVTLREPRTSIGFIDRYLVTAETFRIPVKLIFNKQDVYKKEDLIFQEELINLYESLGYPCLKTSTVSKEGITELSAILENKTSLISGHSGVGKSSLLNVLYPDLELPTAPISGFSEKGVHTTTFAEMFELGPNTYLIDSPGIQEIGLFNIAQEELAHYFPEFRALLNQCRFHNCIHINEPKCAVKEGLAAGHIAESRYLSYLSMFDNEDNRR